MANRKRRVSPLRVLLQECGWRLNEYYALWEVPKDLPDGEVPSPAIAAELVDSVDIRRDAEILVREILVGMEECPDTAPWVEPLVERLQTFNHTSGD